MVERRFVSAQLKQSNWTRFGFALTAFTAIAGFGSAIGFIDLSGIPAWFLWIYALVFGVIYPFLIYPIISIIHNIAESWREARTIDSQSEVKQPVSITFLEDDDEEDEWDAPSGEGILFDTTRQVLDEQLKTLDQINHWISTQFTVGTTVLPITVALFGLKANWGFKFQEVKGTNGVAAVGLEPTYEPIVHMPPSIALPLLAAFGSYCLMLFIFINCARHGEAISAVNPERILDLRNSGVSANSIRRFISVRGIHQRNENNLLLEKKRRDQGMIGSCLGAEVTFLVLAASVLLRFL